MNLRIALVLVLGLIGSLRPGAAEPDRPDKRQYHLFNPTPRELLRDLSADRPDTTESPYTVDAGHVQIETDLFSYTRDHNTSGGGARFRSYTIAAMNFKVGLLDQMDLHVLVDSYVSERTEDVPTGTVARADGFGDVTTRLKINLWGNDGGRTAFSIMPFVKAPTASGGLGNDSVEGGLILPFAAELPGGWSLGLMAEFDFFKDTAGDGYHTEFLNSIVFGHDIAGALAGYVEFVSIASTEPGAHWIGLVSLGLTYGLSADVQLDCGVNLGVNRAAPDFNPFIGLTVRF